MQARLAPKLLASGKRGLAPAVGSGGDLVADALALPDANELLADLGDAPSAGSGDGAGVAVVAVDANKVGNVVRPDVLDDDVARTSVVGAVTAATVELSGVDDGVVSDCYGALAVVLDDLVLSPLGATALDKSIAVLQDGDGVYKVIMSVSNICHCLRLSLIRLTLADIAEPHVPNSAASFAVHALQGIASNDGILKGGPRPKDEHGGIGAVVPVVVARTAAIELAVAHVPKTSDDTGLGKMVDGSIGSGNVEGLGSRGANHGEREEGAGMHLEGGRLSKSFLEKKVCVAVEDCDGAEDLVVADEER
jgi:hypothetical protein